MSDQHQFLRYLAGPPDIKLVRQIAQSLLFYYSGTDQNRHKWKAQRWIEIQYTQKDGSKINSKRFSFDDLEKNISNSRTFGGGNLGLFEPFCPWLDLDFTITANAPINFSIGQHGHSGIGGLPIWLKIDREGYAVDSPQAILQRKVLETHKQIVETSGAFSNADWFLLVRSYICDTISLIDVTLHQTYIKAKYDPLPHWRTFDEDELEKICPRYGGKLTEKLKWINHIAAQPVYYTKEEHAAFERIKCIRNHVMHWDPPGFCYTLEDVLAWLNMLQPIACMLWKMRVALNTSRYALAPGLIHLLLIPAVQFIPLTKAHRKTQPKDVGYASSLWPPDPPKPKKGPAEQKFSFKIKEEQMKALQVEVNLRNQQNTHVKLEVGDLLGELIDQFIATNASSSGNAPTP